MSLGWNNLTRFESAAFQPILEQMALLGQYVSDGFIDVTESKKYVLCDNSCQTIDI